MPRLCGSIQYWAKVGQNPPFNSSMVNTYPKGLPFKVKRHNVEHEKDHMRLLCQVATQISLDLASK